MAFCRNCGSEMQEDAEFCPKCGKAVNDAPKENAAPVTATPNIPVQKSSIDVNGLVLGIISIVLTFFNAITEGFLFIVVLPLGLAGIIFSSIAISRNKKAGQTIRMAIAGLVVSILGIVLSILTIDWRGA